MTLKLISFDVTNTLLKIRGSVGEHYATVANKYFGATGKWFGSERTEQAFMHAYKEVDKLMPNFGYNNNISSEVWWYEVVHRVFHSLGIRDIGILKSISNQLYTDYCASIKYELFPETQLVLQKLKAETEVKVAIISNFDERLEMLLEQLGIRKYFDIVLCSRSVGYVKPDSRIFKTALALCNEIKADEALHVGDNVELDYIASKEAGWHSLLIERGNKRSKGFTHSNLPIYSINTLERLLPYQLKNIEPFKEINFLRLN